MRVSRSGDPDPLQRWRAWLLDRVFVITMLASLVPSALITAQAFAGSSWEHAVLCWACMALLAVLSRRHWAGYRLRAVTGGFLLYAFGLWLLVNGGSVGMLYMLAVPVLLTVVMNTTVAVAALVGTTLTLTFVGAMLELPFPMAMGLPGGSWLRWVTISSNLFWLGLLMTLATGFLLLRLRKALESQRRGATLLNAVASQVPGMVFRLRVQPGLDPLFVYASPGAEGVLGVPADQLLADASALSRGLPEDDLRQLQEAMQQSAKTGEPVALELRVQRADGRTGWVHVQAAVVDRDGAATILNGVITDITERKLADQRIRHQAYTDTLTGLPNRLAFQAQLAQALDQEGVRVALLLMDLDRFKEVNDTQGHGGGDELLVEAGRRLQAAAGSQGTLARAGGDEFVMLLAGPDCESSAASLGARILADLSRPFSVRGEPVFISASVGVSLHPNDGLGADVLFSCADQALYEAKGSGRNRCIRFSPALQLRAQRRVQLAHDLRHAIERGQLSLVYQPVVDLRSEHVCKAEALLRWQHPELGAVSPAEFVPIAESSGLIDRLGAWVLETAACQVARWRRELDPSFRVAINHSPLQFRSAQAPGSSWKLQLEALGIPGEALVVEITEGLLLDHSDALAEQLRELRASGVQVALDDFGTGYSALAYLHRYEIDLIKIDRSFVSGAAAGRTGRSLCRSILALAQELHLEVVAEGVETSEQRDWLRSVGCHHGQGWLFARGLPAGAFDDWWREHHRHPAAGLREQCAVAAA
jgi:diguanylate cyclase (GGDEF)-like protein/PAS domain S-box-containing protein